MDIKGKLLLFLFSSIGSIFCLVILRLLTSIKPSFKTLVISSIIKYSYKTSLIPISFFLLFSINNLFNFFLYTNYVSYTRIGILIYVCEFNVSYFFFREWIFDFIFIPCSIFIVYIFLIGIITSRTT